MAHPYDLLVIGSGPAGQKGAICAAKLGRKVAIIDRPDRIGGVSLHTGTIPSKTLREAALYLSGAGQRVFYGRDYCVKDKISVRDLAERVTPVLKHESEVVRSQLKRNNVEVLYGSARFVDAHTLDVDGQQFSAGNILIACGTRPAESPSIPLDGARVLTSNQLGLLEEIPRQVIIVGGGVIGLEYASMVAAMGTEVVLVDGRRRLLDFVDEEIVDALVYHLRQNGVTMRLGEKVTSCVVEQPAEGSRRGARVVATLESGKTVSADALLYAVGRQANTDRLNLEAAGLTADARGKLEVNEWFQTSVPHVYATGDVIGFPALASTSMEQGRLASCHMFGVPAKFTPDVLPYGIYTIPEISTVGRNEQGLTAARVNYEVGVARYDELAKAQMVGDRTGLLKILFDPKTLAVLGIHAIGHNAAEIIHIGQAVLTLGAPLTYFRDTVFNYPTLAEAYKVAALDGLNKLG